MGWPAVPPSARDGEGAGERRRGAGSRRAARPPSQASRKAASKVSPAPVVSTGVAGSPGTVEQLARRRRRRRRRRAPSLTTTSGPRCGEGRAAAPRVGVAPRARRPRDRLGSSTSRCGSSGVDAAPSAPAGSSLVSSDVVTPRARMLGQQRRQVRGQRRAAGTATTTCTCRRPDRAGRGDGRARPRPRSGSGWRRAGSGSPGRAACGQHDGEPGRHVGAPHDAVDVDPGRREVARSICVAEHVRRRRPPTSADRRGPSRANACAVIAAEPPMVRSRRVEQLLGLAEARARRRRSGPGPGWRRRRRARAARSSRRRTWRHHRGSAHELVQNQSRIGERSCSSASLPCHARPRDHGVLRRRRLGGVHPPAAARPARLRRPRPADPGHARHRPAPARAGRGAGPDRGRRATAARRRCAAEADRRAALAGADFVINSVNIGGHAATVTDFEVPARYGAAPDHRRHPGRRRHLPRAAHLRLPRRAGHRHARGLPGRLAAELHQPDGDEHPVPRHGATRRSRCSACATRCSGPSTTCASWSACRWRRCTSTAPASTTRPGCCEWERDGAEPLPAAGRADRGRPGAAAPGARRHVPAARLLPDRDQRALQRVRRRGTCTTTPRSSGCASRSATTCRSAPATPHEVEALIPQVAAGQYVEPEEDAVEYAPQVIHSLVTGTPRTIQVNVANAGLIANLPAGAGVEVPCRHRRIRRRARSPSATCRRSAPRSTGSSCRSST